MMKSVAIVGLMRSGTTWIGKVLDSSPNVVYLHEPDYVKRIPCVPYTTNAEDAESWTPFIKEYVSQLRTACAARSYLKQPSFRKAFAKTFLDQVYCASFSSLLRSDQIKNRLGMSPVSRTWPRCVENADFLVWKSVEQTGNIGCILRALPEQKLLHIVRHPCGFVDSVLRGQKGKLLQGGVPAYEDVGIFDYVSRTKFAIKLGLRLCDWKALTETERLAYEWLLLNEQAIDDGEELDNYKLVYFDEFCLDPFGYGQELFEFAGIPFGPQTEKFLRDSSGSKSERYYSVARNSETVPRKWEKRLPRESIEQIVKIVSQSSRMKPLLDATVGECVTRGDA